MIGYHFLSPTFPSNSHIQSITIQEMGNDGGDIPGRKELVRDRKKVEIPTAQSIAMGRARFCNLTKEPLTEPLAICRLGYIYNYENLLSALVRKELPEKYGYIKKLTDIKKVKSAIIKIIIQQASKGSDNYIACPISKLEYNGFNKFVTFWDCGHTVSRKALKEVQLDRKACIICQKEYTSSDLIDLNLEPELLEHMRRALIQKKRKKEHKEEVIPQEKQRGLGIDDIHLGVMDRLGGQFRDVIRHRQNFKGIFQKNVQLQPDWKKNTYFVEDKK